MSTKRLILRTVKDGDAEALIDIYNSDFVQRFNVMPKMELEEFKESLKSSEDIFIELIETGEVIGTISVNPDRIRARVKAVCLSYWLGEDYAGKGYMSEALMEVIDHLAEYDVISARVFSGNIGSQRLLEKLQFTREGMLKHAVRDLNDTIHDDILYARYKIKPEAID